MTKLILILTLSTLAACSSDWGYENVVLVPQSGDVARWIDAVNRASGVWNDVLEEACGRKIFSVVQQARIAPEDEHPIQLIEAQDWEHPTLGGYLQDNLIAVKAGYSDADEQMILIHELGHALGLPHITNRPSVMNPAGGELNSQDVDAVIALAGCDE